MENTRDARGFKIQTYNYVMIAAACALYAFLLILTVRVFTRYQAMAGATEDYIRCEQSAFMVEKGSDTLTETARMYVVTGDLSYAEAYFEEANVNRGRERGLKELEEHHPNDQIHLYLETALGYSNDLMKREIYAMALVADAMGADPEDIPREMAEAELDPADLALDREGRLARAKDLVLGQGYKDAKALIESNIGYSLASTLSAMETQHAASTGELLSAIRHQRLCIVLLFIMNVLVFIFTTFLVVRPLRGFIRSVRDNKPVEVAGSYEFRYLARIYNSIYALNAGKEGMQRDQAERDALTGVMNRDSFERLQQNLQDRPVPITLALVDVDDFQAHGGDRGKEAGDGVLKRVAQLLEVSFRSTDFVARVGDGEFCVVMAGAPDHLQATIKARVRAVNDALGSGKDGLPAASISVGAASSARGMSRELYRWADRALYASKAAGRGRCSFYNQAT